MSYLTVSKSYSDDCTCYLTEQNIAVNDHNDAIILYKGHYIKQNTIYI